MQFEVLREHIGDRFYKTGDIREVDEMSVNHLVRNGVLRPIRNPENPAPSSSDPAANASVDGKGKGENPATDSKAEDQGALDTVEKAPELEASHEDKPAVKAKAKAEAPEDQKAETAEVQNKAQGAAPKNKGS